jgi:hypothetical protein
VGYQPKWTGFSDKSAAADRARNNSKRVQRGTARYSERSGIARPACVCR